MLVVILNNKEISVLQTESWIDFIKQVGGNLFDNQNRGLYYTIASVLEQKTLINNNNRYKKFAEKICLKKVMLTIL